jgi:hypothetical protein
VFVDQFADAVVHGVRPVQALHQVVAEAEAAAHDVVEAVVQHHALNRELAQIDVAPAVAPGQIVVGFAPHAFPGRMRRHRQVVLAEVRQPVLGIPVILNGQSVRS